MLACWLGQGRGRERNMKQKSGQSKSVANTYKPVDFLLLSIKPAMYDSLCTPGVIFSKSSIYKSPNIIRPNPRVKLENPSSAISAQKATPA